MIIKLTRLIRDITSVSPPYTITANRNCQKRKREPQKIKTGS